MGQPIRPSVPQPAVVGGRDDDKVYLDDPAGLAQSWSFSNPTPSAGSPQIQQPFTPRPPASTAAAAGVQSELHALPNFGANPAARRHAALSSSAQILMTPPEQPERSSVQRTSFSPNDEVMEVRDSEEDEDELLLRGGAYRHVSTKSAASSAATASKESMDSDHDCKLTCIPSPSLEGSKRNSKLWDPRDRNHSEVRERRSNPIVSSRQLLNAFLGRPIHNRMLAHISEAESDRSTLSSAESREEVGPSPTFGTSASSGAPSTGPSTRSFPTQREDVDVFYEPLEWVLAVSLPNPAFVRASGIGKRQAEKIFAGCFKGEEYEQKNTKLSQQAAAALNEQRLFMKAYEELPDSPDGRGKVLGENYDSFPESQGRSMSSTAGDCELAEARPRSFYHLMRNVIVTKLVLHCGLQVKCALSEDGLKILLLISCTHHELLREADRQSFPTELDVHSADPESLEPCTPTFVPLLHWFFANKMGTVTTEMTRTLQGVLNQRRATLRRLPDKMKSFHRNATRFWETLRGYELNQTSEGLQIGHDDSQHNEASMGFTMRSFSALAHAEDFSVRHHIGSKHRNEAARGAFMDYLERRTEEPLADTTDLLNKIRKKDGAYDLKNYYQRLGVGQISPHCGFEVGAYLGIGLPMQCLWRHFSARCAKQDLFIAIPFRHHQVIKLIMDMIGRQIDMARLIDLGYVTCIFPLDTSDKFEQPFAWVTDKDVTGKPYFFNIITKEARESLPADSQKLLHEPKPSELVRAWGIDFLPEPNLERQPSIKWCCSFGKSFFDPPDVQALRNYYGEEIALYFALTQHLCFWCVVPAGIGLVVGFIEYFYINKGPDLSLTAIHLLFGFLISVWGSLWLEAWKRREVTLAASWGQLGVYHTEIVRPAFQGVLRRSPIDFDNDMDRIEATCCSYGRLGRFPRQVVSWLVMLFVACLHNITMGYLLSLRGHWLNNRWALEERSGFLVAMIFACQMTIFSTAIASLVPFLNKWENYRTHADYASNFIIKSFVLEFVNQFAIFFYIGFIKGGANGCVKWDKDMQRWVQNDAVSSFKMTEINTLMCMEELRAAVSNVLGAMFLMNIIEIVVPAWIIPQLRRLWEKRQASGSKNKKKKLFPKPSDLNQRPPKRTEGADEITHETSVSSFVQFMLDKEIYSGIEASGTYDDFVEIVIFFGHMAMFSVVFPYVPIIVLALVLVEIRVDGHKLLYTLRRPMPRNAEHIGAWHIIFQFITWVSVLTNTLILVFGLEDFDAAFELNGSEKCLVLLAMILSLICFKAFVMIGVPDVPAQLRILLEHHKVVCQQLSSNRVALGPRDVPLDSLDTRVAAASELRPQMGHQFSLGKYE